MLYLIGQDGLTVLLVGWLVEKSCLNSCFVREKDVEINLRAGYEGIEVQFLETGFNLTCQKVGK